MLVFCVEMFWHLLDLFTIYLYSNETFESTLHWTEGEKLPLGFQIFVVLASTFKFSEGDTNKILQLGIQTSHSGWTHCCYIHRGGGPSLSWVINSVWAQHCIDLSIYWMLARSWAISEVLHDVHAILRRKLAFSWGTKIGRLLIWNIDLFFARVLCVSFLSHKGTTHIVDLSSKGERSTPTTYDCRGPRALQNPAIICLVLSAPWMQCS